MAARRGFRRLKARPCPDPRSDVPPAGAFEPIRGTFRRSNGHNCPWRQDLPGSGPRAWQARTAGNRPARHAGQDPRATAGAAGNRRRGRQEPGGNRHTVRSPAGPGGPGPPDLCQATGQSQNGRLESGLSSHWAKLAGGARVQRRRPETPTCDEGTSHPWHGPSSRRRRHMRRRVRTTRAWCYGRSMTSGRSAGRRSRVSRG
jgi:hypothetical protein